MSNTVAFDRPFLETYRGISGVFGEPDGYRADMSGYIDVQELRHSSLYGDEDDRIRVIVGRKGSGKTLYMRRIRDGQPGALSVSRLVVDAEQTQLPTTRQVVSVSRLYPENLLTETWQQLWGKSVLLSVMSNILRNPSFTASVTDWERNSLESDFVQFRQLFGQEERTPFTCLRGFIAQCVDSTDEGSSLRRLNALLDDPQWDDLELRLGRILHGMPPVYLFVDAIDEEFAHAPMEWMRCQKGLFYELMRFLRHRQLGEKLHLIISIRDLVLHSVFRSEHSPRYMGDPRIRVLQWDAKAARTLLDRKAAGVERRYWFSGSRPRGFSHWIGIEGIRLGGDTLDVYDYILAYTQCLPREIVILGNLIGRSMIENDGFSPDLLRHAARTVGRLSALTQLEICANQVRDDAGIRFNGQGGYRAEQEYTDARAQELLNIIASIGHSPMRPGELERLRTEGMYRLEAPDIASVLWQNGLLGYLDGGREIYFSLDSRGRFVVPRALAYVLHPSLAALIEPGDGLWSAV